MSQDEQPTVIDDPSPVHTSKKRPLYGELPKIPARNVTTATMVKDIFYEKGQSFQTQLIDRPPSIPQKYNQQNMSQSISYQVFDLLQDLPDHSFQPNQAPYLPLLRPTRPAQQPEDPEPEGNQRRRRNWPQLVGVRRLPPRTCRSTHMRDRQEDALMSEEVNKTNQYSNLPETELPEGYLQMALTATDFGEFTIDLDNL